MGFHFIFFAIHMRGTYVVFRNHKIKCEAFLFPSPPSPEIKVESLLINIQYGNPLGPKAYTIDMNVEIFRWEKEDNMLTCLFAYRPILAQLHHIIYTLFSHSANGNFNT